MFKKFRDFIFYAMICLTIVLTIVVGWMMYAGIEGGHWNVYIKEDKIDGMTVARASTAVFFESLQFTCDTDGNVVFAVNSIDSSQAKENNSTLEMRVGDYYYAGNVVSDEEEYNGRKNESMIRKSSVIISKDIDTFAKVVEGAGKSIEMYMNGSSYSFSTRGMRDAALEVSEICGIDILSKKTPVINGCFFMSYSNC